ncbi:hypothetical protein GPEL0_01r0427 [Geoanaerobacter pelophilus]|uniref:Uncharacterized protein n=1 Tax=Geoanaerobacter pelophilus TaxID=60036 RepID=A0ABQ0MEI1_9BACT|nr:hypothetical protein GPEL0_01r0427 [Geoanaerobacter pelophilus]
MERKSVSDFSFELGIEPRRNGFLIVGPNLLCEKALNPW